MNVLLSGASGFLGAEILGCLSDIEGFKITTIGRASNNDQIFDLINKIPEQKNKYDMLIHVAGKAHSEPKTEQEKKDFFNVNYIGTKNLLNSLNSKKLPKTIVFISSVAVYGIEEGVGIVETYPLKGSTPYAKSKILAEEEIQMFCDKNKVNYVILRLPLISGSNPPGNLKSMINAIKKGYYFRIGDGSARKSIVSTKDIAKLIPKLYGEKGIYNLTDGVHPSFKEIEDYIAKGFSKKIISFPRIMFDFLGKIGDVIPFFIINTNKLNKITKSLTFSDAKATKELNWKPSPALKTITFK